MKVEEQNTHDNAKKKYLHIIIETLNTTDLMFKIKFASESFLLVFVSSTRQKPINVQ